LGDVFVFREAAVFVFRFRLAVAAFVLDFVLALDFVFDFDFDFDVAAFRRVAELPAREVDAFFFRLEDFFAPDAALRDEDAEVRFRDAVFRFVADFLAEPEVFLFRIVVERPALLLRERDVRPAAERAELSPASSSESLPMSFFATPTAAGIATPSAVPAAIFCGVDSPCCSSSSSVAILHLTLRR
jgi:hypothetical protein